MLDLRGSMQTMVERPPITPPAISVVAARGAQFNRVRQQRRGVLAVLLVVGVGVGAFNATRSDDDQRGISVASEGTTAAGYIAQAPGGYVAEGSWRLTITRRGEIIELSSASSPSCGSTGVILPGDQVRGSITGSTSRLSVGERFSCPG